MTSHLNSLSFRGERGCKFQLLFPGVVHNFWVKALTFVFCYNQNIMIPTNKNVAVLHPYLDKKWWASSMMIYLSTFLQNKNNNVNLYSFSRDKFKFLSFIKIAFVIRKSDYIIIWNSPMQFAAVLSKFLFRSNAKIIWWHHHYPWYYRQNPNVYIKLKRFFEKCIIKSIDSVIVNSKYLQDSIKDIYKVDSKILYPVLDDKFLNYNTSSLNSFSLDGEGGCKKIVKTIFSYWRWVEGKNLEMIFRTYEELKDEVSNLILKIWWEWNEIEKYKNKYKEDKNVIFLWKVNISQIIENLEQSNLFLFPSKIDSFWLVIIESMSIWIPVISYNLSWAKEIVKNWINWYLVDSDSEFIKRSYEILSNSSLEDNLSIGALKTSTTFTIKTFEKQLSKIL